MGGVSMSRVEVMDDKGCSKRFGFSPSMPSFRGLRSIEPISPASSRFGSESFVRTSGQFSGLDICVTGLSKEARNQVKEATERLGGKYSSNLHPQSTHLVVQSLSGSKFKHTLKHGARNGLYVVTIGWFVDSVKRNVRLNESLYTVRGIGENGTRVDQLNRLIGFPAGIHESKRFEAIEKAYPWSFGEDSNRIMDSTLSGLTMFIDSDISTELRNKVIDAVTKEGAAILDRWFVGCNASHVICEGASVYRYIGHANNLVTPLWILKTAKEKLVQRLLHISADLARQIGSLLENAPSNSEETSNTHGFRSNASLEERRKTVHYAKTQIRDRRGLRLQTCQIPIRPITPSTLLDSISWSISEPTATASIYTDSLNSEEDCRDSKTSFTNLTRSLTESEKTELIFKNHFLTILFPIDRFSEMGPSSRTYFSNNGFTCLQVLDHIYSFYQENMSIQEIEAAIHTDSRHADRLRAVYASKETSESGIASFKRIDFLGSRKSFEMLKRVNGDNNSNVYELLIKA